MIAHNRPLLGKEEAQAAHRVLESGWVASGPEVRALEQEFCRYLGLAEGLAVAVSSGSAALYLALWAVQAKHKSVAIPALSCAALRNAVSLIEAHAVVVDSQVNSPNLDLHAAREQGAEIIIAAHMFGVPQALQRQPGEILIEDCAQALGAEVAGVKAGLQGDVGVFSFAATKLITSGGQGGMVVSRNQTLIDAIRDYREFDCRRDAKARFNFTMTDLQAAVGRSQLAKLNSFLSRREAIYRRYIDTGRDFLWSKTIPGITPVRYRAVLGCEDPQKWISALERKGVTAIVPVNDWELLTVSEKVPVAAALTRSTVSIPIFPALTDEQVDSVREALVEGI